MDPKDGPLRAIGFTNEQIKDLIISDNYPLTRPLVRAFAREVLFLRAEIGELVRQRDKRAV